jgi:hypothetical protein
MMPPGETKRIYRGIFTELRQFSFVAANAAGIASYEKFGFEIEGTHRRFAFRDGEYVDAFRWCAFVSEAAVAYPSSRLALTRISTLPLKALETGQP